MTTDLIARLEAASQGFEEWRVQNPETGSYCMHFTRNDSLNPGLAASLWLTQFQKDYPDHPHAKYVVAKVRAYSQRDELIREAIAALQAQPETRDDASIEAAAHRTAWRYRKSSDPAHSDTYTFNRATLLDFARSLGIKA